MREKGQQGQRLHPRRAAREERVLWTRQEPRGSVTGDRGVLKANRQMVKL